MSIKVKAPNANFEGMIADVLFTRGVAIFENEGKGRHVAQMLGFEVINEKPVKEVVEDVPDVEPKKRTKAKK